MSQVKIYGLRDQLAPRREALSKVIHQCVMEVLGLPAEKRFHRFFCLEPEEFLYPADRSQAYTIVEISMMSGRSVSTRKQLVRSLFDTIEREVGIAQQDLEICIYESEPCNWGFRGFHGDEAKLNYRVSQ